ncbi:MAG: hypothetical protein NQ127_02480 [Candidatus Cardinium sp.]|nr:hypothetical protein [Candidatus Cardinium sp.]
MWSTYTKGISVLLVAWSSFALWGCNRMDIEMRGNGRLNGIYEDDIPLTKVGTWDENERYNNQTVIDALNKVEKNIMHELFILLKKQENKSGKWQAIVSGSKDFLIRNCPSCIALGLYSIPAICYFRSLSPDCLLSDQNTEIEKALTDAIGDLTAINFGYSSRAFRAVCNHGNERHYHYSDTRSIFPFINEKIFDPLVQQWYRACPRQGLGIGRIMGAIAVGEGLVILTKLILYGSRVAVTNCITKASHGIILNPLMKVLHFLDNFKEEHCLSDDALFSLKHEIENQYIALEGRLREPESNKLEAKAILRRGILIDQIKKRIASISDAEEKNSFKDRCGNLVKAGEREFEDMVNTITS